MGAAGFSGPPAAPMSTPLFTHLISATPDAAEAPDAHARFFRLLETALATSRLTQLVLAGYRGGEAGLQRVIARPVTIKGEPQLSLVWRYRTRDITKNHALPQALALLRAWVGTDFRNAHLHTPDQEVQFALSKKGKGSLRLSDAAAGPAAAEGPEEAASQAHNRAKQRWVALEAPHWVDLGLATADGQLVPAMARKWKQINKFVEVFAAAFSASPLAKRPADAPVRVADFGAGKGYLTFALYEYLRGQGRRAEVTGIELRDDLVRLCNQAAGLRFDCGDVRSHPPGQLDVMIALHACDIATDHAIHVGLRAGASIILCAPCCHKQLRPQMTLPAALRPMLRHGIHLGQEAEMVTDSLRALLLEAEGYDTQVFEFVSLEHTAKNKMILAVKREQPLHAARVAELRAQVAQIKAFYGLREQCLESLLLAQERAAGVGAPACAIEPEASEDQRQR